MSEKKKRKPDKVPTESLPIYTWSPDQPGKPHLAQIGNLPMNFTGSTSEEAAQIAHEWRRAEMAKHAKAEENRAAMSARMKARKVKEPTK